MRTQFLMSMLKVIFSQSPSNMRQIVQVRLTFHTNRLPPHNQHMKSFASLSATRLPPRALGGRGTRSMTEAESYEAFAVIAAHQNELMFGYFSIVFAFLTMSYFVADKLDRFLATIAGVLYSLCCLWFASNLYGWHTFMRHITIVTRNVIGYTYLRDPRLPTQGAGTVLSDRNKIRHSSSRCLAFKAHSGSPRCSDSATGYGSTWPFFASIEGQVSWSLVRSGKRKLENHFRILRPGCN